MPENNKQPITLIDYNELQKLASIANRNITLYGQKKSQYDNEFIIPEYGDRAEALNEYRAQQQPWYDKLTNSVVKGTAIAGTTFIDTFAGTAAGLLNMGVVGGDILNSDTDYDNWDATKKIFNAFINNPVSVALNDFNEMLANDVLVNYRTKKEMDNAWYENAIGMGGVSGITNFWGEDFIKNSGFIVGAGFAGKGIAALGSKLTRLEAGRKEFDSIRKAAEKALGGVDLSNKSIAELQQIMLNNPELYKTVSKNVIDDFAKAAISTRNKEFGIQVAASTLGSFGEARVEALGNANVYREERERELKTAFDNNELTEEEYLQAKGRIEKEVEAYQNSSFLLNSILLGASNYSGLRNAYLKPYDYAVKNRLGEAIKITEGAEKGLYKYISPTKKGLAAKSAFNVIRESQEEQLQFVIDKTVGQWVRTNKNGESVKSFVESLGEGLAEAYGSAEGWENAVIGGLFGAIGVPGMGGGAISEYRELSKQSKEEQEIVNNLNKLIKENKLEDKSTNLLKAVIKDFNLRSKENFAIDNDDQYTYQEAKDQSFFNIANAFIDAGKYEDLIDLYERENELSAEELRKKYTYLKKKEDESSRTSYFENRTNDEVKQYIREKTSNAIEQVKKLRDLKDSLGTLYRNELIKVKNKEGVDMEIAVKDFLTEQFYMGEARDKRIAKLKNEIFTELNSINIKQDLESTENESEDIKKALALVEKKINDIFRKRYETKEKQKETKEKGLKIAKELEKDLSEEGEEELNNLIKKLKQYRDLGYKLETDRKGKIKKVKDKKDGKEKAKRNKQSEKRYAIISDYINLLSERALSNYYLTQLSNNNFSELISEMKKQEKEVQDEIAKNAKSNLDDDDKYKQLIEQAKEAGYITKSDKVYFELNGELYVATYDSNGKRTSKNVFTQQVLLVNQKDNQNNIVKQYEPDIFDRSFLLENYDKIKFVSIEDAEKLVENKRLRDNVLALTETVNEQIKTISDTINEVNTEIEEWKNQKDDLLITSSILLEDIKNTKYNRNFTEKRKQWKKQLKEFEKQIAEIDNKINKLNSLKTDLQNQLEGFRLLKNDIAYSKTVVDINQITDIFYDKILEKEIDSELTGKVLDTVESLEGTILELEDEKKYILKVIEQLQNLINLSDATVKQYYSILDSTFRNKWGFLPGINEEKVFDKNTIHKNLNKNRRKLKEYAERNGISLNEANNQFLESAKQLENARSSYEDLYNLENLLVVNKQDLENIDKTLQELYDRFDEAIKYDSLLKKYNALSTNLKELNIIYNKALAKINRNRVVQESIYKDGDKLYSDPNDEQSYKTVVSINDNILSDQIFYSTGRDSQNVLLFNGTYQDLLNDEGLPELNNDPSAQAFIKFANKYFDIFDNAEKSKDYALQVKKYDPNTASKEVTAQIGTNVTGNDYYVQLVYKATGQPVYIDNKGNIAKEGISVFRFIPLTDNLLNPEFGSKIKLDSLRNYVKLKGYTTLITKEEVGTKKYTIKKDKEEYTFNTEEEFVKKLISITATYHKKFIDTIDKQLSEGKAVYLEIGGMNQGVMVTKTKDNQKERTNIYETLINSNRGVSIDNNGKLKGAEILVFNKKELRLPNNKIINGRPGTSVLYIEKTGEIIPLNTDFLQNEDINTLLHLINAAYQSPIFSELTLDLPKNKYVLLGGKQNNKLPIFGKGRQYSIINALTYWGKSNDNNITNQFGGFGIYIYSGKVYYGNKYMNLTDVLNTEKNGDLIQFLSNKKYNISNIHLNTPGRYFHPRINEKNEIEFEEYKSYEDFLFKNNILYSTMASSNENNYDKNLLFLSRNFIFMKDNNGDPIILNSLNNKPTTNTNNQNPVQQNPPTQTSSGTYKELDQITVSNSGDYNFENLENKYIKVIFGQNNIIFKIKSDGFLEFVNASNEKAKNWLNAFNQVFIDENITDKNERINETLSNILKNDQYSMFLVEPTTVDINDPEVVEEEKDKCETGKGTTTDSTNSPKKYKRPQNNQSSNSNHNSGL